MDSSTLPDNRSGRRLRRALASKYLDERWDIKRTPGTLAKYAVTGGGPKFQYDNRTPLYPVEELDAWAQLQLSPLRSSTSDSKGNANGIMEAAHTS